MIDKEQYIYEKYIYFLIFDNIKEKNQNQEWINDIQTLTSLKQVLSEFIKYNHMSLEIKEKLFDVISCSRNLKTDNYEQKVEILNDIIRLINSQRKDNSDEFYRGEACRRYGTTKYSLSDYSIDEYIAELNDSIAYDFIIVYTHAMFNDNSFNNIIGDFSQEFRKYYLSLNAILKENPYLFKDDKFKSRVFMILNEISKKYPEGKKSNNQIKKYISKI